MAQAAERRDTMTFSKPFITIACILLVLVGAALGYSAKLVQQIVVMDGKVNLIDYDLRGLEYRIFILESQQLTMEPPEKAQCAYYGLGYAGRKGQFLSLPVSN
jgi:hypothetical protein